MLDELVESLRNYKRKDIAEKTGLSICTVNFIMSGRNKNPRLDTILALQEYITKQERKK